MNDELETIQNTSLHSVTGGATDATRPAPIGLYDSTAKTRQDTQSMRDSISRLSQQQARQILVRDYGSGALRR